MSSLTKKIIVGMSGGVDSSVSALLLKQKKLHVECLFMKNWDEDDGSEYCTAKQDLADAQSVCNKLNIKLHTINFSAEYWDNVFEHFLHEYRNARTPNPDILCNKEIKFKAFLNYAQHLEADYIAMGHYANISKKNNQIFLRKGLDQNKDQTYFLHQVGQEQLKRTIFPIGHLLKLQVRQIAKEYNLINHDKKDSTGICFIGERKFKDFLKQYLPAQPGLIQNDNGKFIGKHSGLMFYTIGQRQGLGIGGVKNLPEKPWYVLGKNTKDNILIVGQGDNHHLLFSQALLTNNVFWISGHEPNIYPIIHCKIRYRQTDQQCQLIKLTDKNDYLVVFDQLQRAITPGQSIVFYKEDICLGGGIINQRFHSKEIAYKELSISSNQTSY